MKKKLLLISLDAMIGKDIEIKKLLYVICRHGLEGDTFVHCREELMEAVVPLLHWSCKFLRGGLKVYCAYVRERRT